MTDNQAPVSDDIVDQAYRALNSRTPGAWRWSGGEEDNPDLVFIDDAPGLMFKLIAEIKRLRASGAA